MTPRASANSTTSPTPSTLRCAIYTRKSSEEGLDMAFNSLDAQREACLDYIKSQRHQGWCAIADAYDDGGYSGGSTDRPGLQRLLMAIQAGRVDVVVVYKVDRLSRSLADFARLMQLFDEQRVSFVSVTQQFNTTSSMGRLTLNMLLSFAQFEREVAGERIRDKIAATFRRGVFVTGQPPLGYRRPREGEPGFIERKLLIVPEEAELVRSVYTGYLELRSLVALAARLNAAGHRTKFWTSSRGTSRGGKPFTASLVHRILTNPIYIGKIAHTRRVVSTAPGARRPESVTEVHDGLHDPIIPHELWDKVHDAMKVANRGTTTRWTHTHLLKGKLRTFEGHTMSPSSTQLKRDDKTRDPNRRIVRYYVSQKAVKHGYAACPIKSLNANVIDDLVRALVVDHLARAHQTNLRPHEHSLRDHWLREVIGRVVVALDRISIDLIDERVKACTEAIKAIPVPKPASKDPAACTVPTSPFKPSVTTQDGHTTLTLAILIKRLDGRRMLLSPDGHDLLLSSQGGSRAHAHPQLVLAIGQAFAFRADLLRTSDSVESIAGRSGCSAARVKQLLMLTQLSPRILRAALTAGLPPRLTVSDLIKAAQRLEWPQQEILLGLARS
ncbi:MAG: recombinase family protein [Phycisphaeraceae bacterium]|nr:recombinase family protein [Phycisphaeraceae bacterium]